MKEPDPFPEGAFVNLWRKKIPIRPFFLLCCFWSAGCATFAPKPSWVVESNEKTVKGCRFLGTVEGNSSWGWLIEEGSLERAETEALHHAAALGATHLVWTKRGSARWSHHVEGRAYDCQ
jgi:hypothetical protein